MNNLVNGGSDNPTPDNPQPCPLGTADWISGAQRCKNSGECQYFTHCIDRRVQIDEGFARLVYAGDYDESDFDDDSYFL